MKINFKKLNGLVPVIIQDALTNQVLMLGFMNQAAFDKTLTEKKVTFYSRSKERLWTKGEKSGNCLEVIDIKTDCDNDTLLIKAKPSGPTCHTGAYSCFGETEKNSLDFLSELYQLIQDRKVKLPGNSYTADLFKQGLAKINAKIIEEAGEIVQAVAGEGRQRTIEEISDFIYHLQVLMVEQGIGWEDIMGCLRKRQN